MKALFPRRFSRRLLPAAVTLVVGLALSAGLFLFERHAVQEKARTAFDDSARALALAIQENIESYLRSGYPLQALYATGENVHWEQFRAFVQHDLKQRPGLRWLAWVPRVPDANRSALEAHEHGEGLIGWQVTQLDAQARPVREPQQPVYFPIQFLESLHFSAQGLGRLSGLDLGTVPAWRAAMDQARDRGQPEAVPAGLYVPSLGGPSTLMLFHPIYAEGEAPQGVDDRRADLVGFVVAVIDAQDVVEPALHSGLQLAGGMRLSTRMDVAGAGSHEIDVHADGPAAPAPSVDRGRLRYTHDFQAGGRGWSVVATAAPGFFVSKEAGLPWMVLGLGLALTVIAVGYLLAALWAERQREAESARRLAEAERKEAENAMLNDSIIDILQSVSRLSRGDLTVTVPLHEDVTGALSDAINVMAESTSLTLSEIDRFSGEVQRAATEVRQQAMGVARAAEEGTAVVDQAVGDLAAAVASMQHIAEVARHCSEIAVHARGTTQKSKDTVLSTAMEMNEIRGTIQETAKRIKRLGERSQEIGGIVKVIDEIAERTSVLALNANMQAATAGEAGRGFRVVADEVQRLAERSKEATDQIAKLVGNIQSETQETMATMDRAIDEVVKGGDLAERSADEMQATERATDELTENVNQIARASHAQVVIDDALADRMKQVREHAIGALTSLRIQAQHINRLGELSNHLLGAVRAFRLPAAPSAIPDCEPSDPERDRRIA